MRTETSHPIRTALRHLFVVVAAILTSPFWLIAWLEAAVSTKDGVFKSCAEFLSLFPGKPGIFLRRGYYGMCLEQFSTDCHIGFGTLFAHPQVRIGRGVYIGDRCTLGRVHIDDHATLGSNVDVLSGRRQHHFDLLTVPIQEQGGVFEQVTIGRNTWVGNSSVIMADLGEDCVIGAGSVVVRPIPPRSVAAGNPATVKKERATRTPGQPVTPFPVSRASGIS
jgi:acetyltransferase-like isoleucine patch superfamily enzyme